MTDNQTQLFAQPHFDGEHYFNPFPTFQARGMKDALRWLVWDRLTGKRKPIHVKTPFLTPTNSDLNRLRENRQQFSVTWIGHSTLFIQIDGLNILTDPMFSERASPVSFVGPKRISPPGIPLDLLPSIDLVLISHDHYDHLDKKSIKRLGNRPFYVVPEGVGNILRAWGITNFAEMDWWNTSLFKGIEIVCTPAQHFSGRLPFNQNHTLWVSWVLKGGQETVYFGGDTGYFPAFKQIARIYGPIDFAALPIGAYEPRWFMKPIHMNPQDALRAFKDLGAKVFIPIHWGTFILTDEAPEAPMELLKQKAGEAGLANRIWGFKLGETKWQ